MMMFVRGSLRKLPNIVAMGSDEKRGLEGDATRMANLDSLRQRDLTDRTERLVSYREQLHREGGWIDALFDPSRSRDAAHRAEMMIAADHELRRAGLEFDEIARKKRP